MIYNREESEVQVLGEVQRHKVSIDERNINHIVTILSSNLYSFPMTSFLRETVSNALDSQVEAGVDEPVIITLEDDSIAIRDFGTGISPERFKEIYLNIGSSTKRESNEYIGSFGIGRFSCLSVSSLANITSFYEGKAYYYVMNKDIDQLHIDLMYVKDTDERNGVEVKVPYKDFDPDDLCCLSFIENVYVQDNRSRTQYSVERFNKRKIVSCENFKTTDFYGSSYRPNPRVLIGKIPYEIDWDKVVGYTEYNGWEKAFRYIAPCISIGEVDITPNREALLHSERTDAVLKRVFEESRKELEDMFHNQYKDEFTDFHEYMKGMVERYTNTVSLDGITIDVSSNLTADLRFKGRDSWNEMHPDRRKILLRNIWYTEAGMLALYSDGTLFKGRNVQNNQVRNMMMTASQENVKVFIVPSTAGFSSKYFKDYMVYTYGDKKMMFIKKPYIDIHSIRRYIRTEFGVTTLSSKKDCIAIVQMLKELMKWVAQRAEYLDIMNDEGYQQYKKENAEPKARKSTYTGNIKFTIHNPTKPYDTDYLSCTIDEMLRKVKYHHPRHRIVYAATGNVFIDAFMLLKYPNLIIVEVAGGRLKNLEESLPSYIRPIEELYSEDNRTLQKMATIRELSRQYTFYTATGFPDEVNAAIDKLKEWDDLYNNGRCSSYILDIVPKEKHDREMLAAFHKVEPYLEMRTRAHGELDADNVYAWYFLMKSKKMRIGFDMYRRARNEINNIMNI